MKILSIFTVLIALLCGLICKAGTIQSSDFDHIGYPANGPFNLIVTNNATSFFTNLTTAGATLTINLTNNFQADRSVYHDFQEVVTNLGTNTIAIILSKTINGSDYVPFSTNATVSLTGNYTNFDVTLTGVAIGFRETVLWGGTNDLVNIYYAGH